MASTVLLIKSLDGHSLGITIWRLLTALASLCQRQPEGQAHHFILRFSGT